MLPKSCTKPLFLLCTGELPRHDAFCTTFGVCDICSAQGHVQTIGNITAGCYVFSLLFQVGKLRPSLLTKSHKKELWPVWCINLSKYAGCIKLSRSNCRHVPYGYFIHSFIHSSRHAMPYCKCESPGHRELGLSNTDLLPALTHTCSEIGQRQGSSLC